MNPQPATQAELQELRRLSRRRSSRSAASLFLVDGPTLVAEALGSELLVQTVFVDEDSVGEKHIQSVLDAAGSSNAAVKTVASGRLKKVLDLPAPQPMVATVSMPRVELESVVNKAVAENRPILGLIEVQDPGNVGTMVRVAEAAGYGAVFVSEGSVDVYNPKTVRATAGALFRLPVISGRAIDEFMSAIEHVNIPVHSTIIRTGLSPDELDLTGSHLLLIGSESHGLPEDLANFSPVSIPMEGNVESLNAGVAAAIICFESARQRRHRMAHETVENESELR